MAKYLYPIICHIKLSIIHSKYQTNVEYIKNTLVKSKLNTLGKSKKKMYILRTRELNNHLTAFEKQKQKQTNCTYRTVAPPAVAERVQREEAPLRDVSFPRFWNSRPHPFSASSLSKFNTATT